MPGTISQVGKIQRARTPTERERYAYSFILEALTQGLYPNAFDVLREYIQNGYDAILKHMGIYHQQDYKVKINITGNSIFIADNGIGMRLDQIKQYRFIGYSEKKLGEEAGFRGIGKIAGLSVAEKLIVTSKAQGESRQYTLSFDAQDMLEEILILKAEGKNKPFDELISDHTKLESHEEDASNHYTVVELYQIRPEFAALLDPSRVRDYVRAVAPVPFNPQFKFSDEINRWLIGRVQDYYYIPHFVNDEPVYKPFTNEVSSPKFFTVETQEGNEDAIAYAWACGNITESQLPEPGPRGLIFRLKNIAIGSGDLVRNMLWTTNGHLAYWYFGEIHIVDSEVIPTAERSNFEDNHGRHRLVERSRADVISHLNRDARDRSGQANAEKRLQELQALVNNTELALNQADIRREEVVYEAAKLVNAMDKAKKTKSRLPEDQKTKANEVIERAEGLVDTFQKVALESGPAKGILDIKSHLQLSEVEWKLYDVVMISLRDFFVNEEKTYISIVRAIQDRMLQTYA